MVEWSIVIASETVEREIAALSAGHEADFLRIGELLKEHGPMAVGMPHVRPLGDKLWEMRLRDASGIARAIHFAASGLLWFTRSRSGRKRRPNGHLIWRDGACGSSTNDADI